MFPSFYRDDGNPAFYILVQPSFTINHLGKLANGASMKHRDRMHADKTFLLIFSDRTIYIIARIRTIGDYQLFIVFGSCFHYIMHGADVGVETGAYILNVENHDVYIRKLFGGRLLVFAV